MTQAAGQYDYGIQLEANQGIVFAPGNEIILTGLFGVTGASVLPGLAFAFDTAFSTETSAAIVDIVPVVLDPIPMTHTVAAVRITSSAIASGPVGYEIETGGGSTFSGEVPGPVAPVPEPGALALGAGAFAIFVALKKRRC
jgi:hypothetical protein